MRSSRRSPRWLSAGVGLGLTALVAGGAIADAPIREGVRYHNPVLAQDGPDPFVVRGEDAWYLVTTGANESGAFPMHRSSDLVHWQPAGSIFLRSLEPTWAVRDHWAPEIYRVGEGWIAYFTARDRRGRLCVGAATSSIAAGPYTDIGHPLVEGRRAGVIDPTLLRDDDGTLYLYWKEDGNDIGERCRILGARLSADGRRVEGAPVLLVENDPESWEGDVAEAPEVVKRAGAYYLFYSGNFYASASYAEGVARGASPLGPFIKHPGPILTSSRDWKGPGHACLVTDAAGQDWLFYHAWQRGRIGRKPGREVLLDRVIWGKDGWPHVGEGRPSSGERSGPVPVEVRRNG